MSTPSNTKEPEADNADFNLELFQIIDESGEGFGFELTPEALIRPILIGTGTLFGVGMLAGVPIGIAMGRSAEDSGRRGSGTKVVGKSPPRPSLDGLKFAATTFGLGTLLCASVGLVSFYSVKRYYQVETFEEFGQIMRKSIPNRRSQMESGLTPILESVRQTAGDGMPTFAQRWQRRIEHSRLGRWIKKQVDESVNIIASDEQLEPQRQKPQQQRQERLVKDDERT